MSVEVYDKNAESLGQFASSSGYSDLIEASQSNQVLKEFFDNASSEDESIAEIVKELHALKAPVDVKSSADALADLIKDQELVFISNGTYAEPDEDSVDKGGPGSGPQGHAAFRDMHHTAIKYGYRHQAENSRSTSTEYVHSSGASLSLANNGSDWVSSVRGDAADLGAHLSALHSYAGAYLKADDETVDSDRWEMQGSVVKLDKAKHLVFGWFSVVSIDGKTVTDTQGDQIAPDTLETSAYEFVLNARKAGEMHEAGGDGEIRGIGRLIESMIFTPSKQAAMLQSLHDQGIKDAELNLKVTGWWGGFFIDSEDVWDQIVTGKLKAFSIGGRGKRASL